MHIRQCALTAIIVVAIQTASAAPAWAQGCILFRQTSPMFGTTGSLEQEVGSWSLSFTARSSTADIHYRGSERQYQREQEGTYVVNRQNSITAAIGYQLSPRVSVSVGIPFVEASWGIPSPRSGGPAARANENARGLGDITTLARVALFDPSSHRTWNLQVGGGVKLPTGANAATDVFPDGNGNDNLERYVDISVHPGDGGWGVIFDLLSYKSIRRFMLFGSGTWLANPRNTGTASRGNLVTNTRPTNVNTVSDQFVFRAGTSMGISRHVAASIAWRMEGVPRYDLFGRSDGFRRPGVEMYWEPGVTVTAGAHAVSFNIPVGYYFNRFRNPYTGTPGDSTFPEVVAIGTYSIGIGRTSKRGREVTDQPADGLLPFPPGPPDQDQQSEE